MRDGVKSSHKATIFSTKLEMNCGLEIGLQLLRSLAFATGFLRTRVTTGFERK